MDPVKKLKIQMAIIDFPVLGSVFIYFDNPATLLILDIKIYPTIFLKSHIKVSHNEYIKLVKKIIYISLIHNSTYNNIKFSPYTILNYLKLFPV